MTKQLTEMESPFTGGRVFLVSDVERKTFRGESYDVHVRYYLCEDTGEQFTADNQDDLWCNELYGQYRARHNIPFPEEIVRIRQRSGLSYVQISKILGIGINQYRNYEKGQIPSESNGRLINMISTRRGLLSMLESCRSEFDEDEFNSMADKACHMEDVDQDAMSNRLFYGTSTKAGIENGYGAMNVGKLCEMVVTLVNAMPGICPTKLNKIMFYSDFAHYRQYGQSISGLRYRAVQYGPVPEHYDTIYDNIDGLEKSVFFNGDNEVTSLGVSVYPEPRFLSSNELATMDSIIQKFRAAKASDLVRLSHDEDGWKDNQQTHSIIPYSYAFTLKAV